MCKGGETIKKGERLPLLVISLILFCSSLHSLTATAQPVISIGKYLQVGSYHGEPILWRCVDIDQHGPLMLSDKILTLKAFDAAGKHPDDHNDNRLSGGSDLWESSNIRAWLNSTAGAGNVKWPCGNPPATDRASSGAQSRRWRKGGKYNSYISEKGFLSEGNFRESERSVIKTVTQKSLLNSSDLKLATSGNTLYFYHYDISYKISVPVKNYDASYSHHVTDRMFLLDMMQIFRVNQNLKNYHLSRHTQKAVTNSDFQSSDFASDRNWHYWLRSPFPTKKYNNSVRYVTSMGYLFHNKASISCNGVRPAFYIDLSSARFKSGNGSAGNPYTIGP